VSRRIASIVAKVVSPAWASSVMRSASTAVAVVTVHHRSRRRGLNPAAAGR
jgi:hypothetical protein